MCVESTDIIAWAVEYSENSLPTATAKPLFFRAAPKAAPGIAGARKFDHKEFQSSWIPKATCYVNEAIYWQ